MADRSDPEQSKGPIEKAKEWLQPGGSQTGPVRADALVQRGQTNRRLIASCIVFKVQQETSSSVPNAAASQQAAQSTPSNSPVEVPPADQLKLVDNMPRRGQGQCMQYECVMIHL